VLARHDEAIVSPSLNIENNTLDFSLIAEDIALSEQPFDFNWIKSLQMFEVPIVISK
jgi:hypothetical protein